MTPTTKEKFERWRQRAIDFDSQMAPPSEEFEKHPKRRRAYLIGWYDAISNVMRELDWE